MNSSLTSGRVVRRFADRVAADLTREPLVLARDEHRRRLGELLAVCGRLTHYELLEIATHATDSDVHAAYERLARVVHPVHAENLDLRGREAALELLFERATEAYLVLSDPDRRRDYDRIAAVEVERPIEERQVEARQWAHELFVRARWLLDEQDYHFAVELLRQAVRADPRPEYWALLGKAQSKNAAWLHMAADSMNQAILLEPTNTDHRLALGEIHERAGDFEAARRAYRDILDRSPNHAEAQARFARVATAGKQDSSKKPWG